MIEKCKNNCELVIDIKDCHGTVGYQCCKRGSGKLKEKVALKDGREKDGQAATM